MYSSVTVTVLAKIWSAIQLGYEHSLFKKIMSTIGKGFKYISKGSNFLRLFSSNRKMAGETLFYKIYCKFIDLIYKLVEAIRKLINKGKGGSVLDSSATVLFRDKIEIQNTFAVFSLFFGLTVFIFNAVRGKFLGKSFYVSIFVLLIGIFGLKYEGGYKMLLEESNSFKFLKSLFTTDKGGERWW